MPTFEERLAYLEGRVEEHSRSVDGTREALLHLGQGIDRRFEALEAKIDRRLEVLDAKIDLTRETLDQKMSRHFLWLVGIQVTTLVAIVGSLLTR